MNTFKIIIDTELSVTRFIISICSIMIAFVLFQLSTGRFLNRFISNLKGDYGNIIKVVLQRLVGVLLFGLFPFIVLQTWFGNSIEFYGFKWPEYNYILYIVLFLAVILPVVNFYNSKSAENIRIYPQIRKREWGPGLFIINAFTWAFYLFAYEFMFRGFLLFESVDYLGIFGAIAVNTVIYSIYHFPKGYKESVASIPFGIVLCFIALETSSFFYPFLLHLTLALSNDGFSLKANPDMRLSFRTKRF